MSASVHKLIKQKETTLAEGKKKFAI